MSDVRARIRGGLRAGAPFQPLDPELHRARLAAHEVFDALWLRVQEHRGCTKKVARDAGYHWLTRKLGIKRSECHISLFDIETCRRVVEICDREPRTY